jgi:hypothetical protein
MPEGIGSSRVWQGSAGIALRERDDQCNSYLFGRI